MSFITPAFLFAASAALLPVIFHLIRRFRARRVRFSSLLFLRATPKKLIKRRRLRDILLLIVRAALLALLALMFARPFMPRETLPVVLQESDTSTVILLDTSYSMRHSDWFDEARDAALDVIGDADGMDEVALVIFSDHAEQVSELTGDMALLRGLVRDMVPGYRTTDLWQPLRLAGELLEHARNDRRRIVMISDFQSAGWDNRIGNWNPGDEVSFEPVKIGGTGDANAFIDQAVIDQRRIGDAETVQFRLQVRTDGSGARDDHEVSLWLDGERIEGKSTPARASSQVYFQRDDLREGLYQGRLAIGDDNLDTDNDRYFTFAVSRRPAVLCVDGSPSSTRSNAFFLASCFDMADRSRYEFGTASADRLNDAYLAGQDLLFLANPPDLTAAQTRAVRSFVENGGSVIVSFGDRTDAEFSTRLLGELGAGTLIARVDARRERSMPVFVSEMDVRHPVFSVFSASGAGDLARPRFNEYVAVTPDSAASVIARFDTGEPFLIERRLGTGRVLVMATSINTEWGDFPVNDIFLPFVYQLAGYALSTTDGGTAFTVGDQVPLTGTSDDQWEVRTPDGRIVRVTVDEAGTGWFRDTGLPGNYQAERDGDRHLFSVNVDTRESDLTAMDAGEVRAAVTGGAGGGGASEFAASGATTEEERNQKLWRAVLLAIVGLFMAETCLANRKMSISFGDSVS